MSDFKVYIESPDGVYPTLNEGWVALEGWRNRGLYPIMFEDIMEVPAQRTNIVVASVNNTITFLERLGIKVPLALNIPEEIEVFAGRKINRGYTLDKFKTSFWSYPIFVKGAGFAKRIYPEIIKSDADRDNYPNKFLNQEYSIDEPLLISSVENFVSEWRVYVTKGEIQGIFNYSGDMFDFPNTGVIHHCIDQYKSAPAGYGIDFGITNYGSTKLIEVNDGWSLGNYGLEPNKYIKLLSARWLELIKIK